MMFTKISSYEAKTKLPELLRCVQAGNRYTITLRGKPVADLVPAEAAKYNDTAASVEAMREFMNSAPQVQGVELKSLIEEDRA